jgi:hypothetical protein
MTYHRSAAVRLLTALAATLPGFCQAIETPRLHVSLKPGAGLEVLDKKAGVVWRQPASTLPVENVQASAGRIAFRIAEKLVVTVTAQDSAVDLVLSGDPQASVEGLEYPPGFVLPEEGAQRLLLPNCGGLGIPFSMRDDPYLQRVKGLYDANVGQAGLTMPWVGITNGTAGSMMLITTPFDARVNVSTGGHGYQTAVRWRDSKGRLSYDRRVRFLFSDSGGYVSLAKQYRRYAIDQGLFVSLKEKRKTVPALDGFAGLMNLWIVEWPDISLIEHMKAAGLERLLVSYHVSRRPPGLVLKPGRSATYEAVDRDYAAKLHGLGLLAGRYDYYRTIFPPSRQQGQWIMRRTGYPEQCAVDEKGNIRPGFMGKPGDKEILGHRCSWRQWEMTQAYVPADVDRVGYDARLIDTTAAVGWQECYSPFHPVTRAEDAQYRIRQLAFVKDYGQITGTEHVADWAVPVIHYAEAPTTFVRFFPNRVPPREKLIPVPIEVPEEYRQVVLNERLRLPLWQLVFHDAVVITNRWDWTPNRYADNSDWDKEDLINLLHGQMPTMLTDRANFEARRERFARTFNTVCRWNERTGFEEMVDHRWLTDDGSVQQVTYESGRRAVVNFGASEVRLPDGRVAPARGFVLYDKN